MKLSADQFARCAHQGQVRKYTGEPYINHCESVAARVYALGGCPSMISAAWLHDTLEDTDVTREQIQWGFGDRVLRLVEELTDVFTSEAFPTHSRRLRKVSEAARYRTGVSVKGCVIKWCDLQDNTSSIVEHDPKFAIVYLHEKADLLEAMLPKLDKWRHRK